ncbi:MAG: hypothetical protein ACI3ZF_00130, partial [Candidatus Cryptobacteroides sp.]
DADLSIAADSTTATATFKNVDRGACTLYIVANLPEGSTLPESYPVGSNIGEAFLKYVLPEVVDKLPPYDEANSAIGMPLSTSVSLSVGAGTNRVSAEVVRCCAKITLKIRNNTLENTIILKDLAFSNCNPNKGYLFQQSDYSIPGDTKFGPFKDFSLTKGEPTEKHIVHGEEEIYLQQYMYENINAGADTLGFYISGALFPDNVTSGIFKDVQITTGGYSLESDVTVQTTETNTLYLIASGNYFLYNDTNNEVKAVLTSFDELLKLDEDELKRYLWTFSADGTSSTKTSNTRIINNSSGFNLSINSSITLEKSNVTLQRSAFSSINNGFTLKNKNQFYYLSVSSGTITSVSSSVLASYFQLYKVKYETPVTTTEEKLVATDGSAAEVYFDKTISSLNYINKYGIPVPLEQIYRNQDVQIVVNIHYNPNSGVLYFETSDWVEEDKNDTTFD